MSEKSEHPSTAYAGQWAHHLSVAYAWYHQATCLKMYKVELLAYSPTPNSGSSLRAYFGLRRRVQANSSVSSDGLLWLRLALTEQLVDENSPKGRSTNATKREAADIDGEVASTHYESNCRRYQVAAL